MTDRQSRKRPGHRSIPALVMALPLITALILAACAGDDDQARGSSVSGPSVTTASTVPARSTETTVAPALPEGIVRTTSGDAAGNRLSPGRGNLMDAAAVDISLSGIPRWVVGADTERGVTWIVVLDDGRLEGWRWENGRPG